MGRGQTQPLGFGRILADMECRAISVSSSVCVNKVPWIYCICLVLIVVLGVALLGAAFTALRWNVGCVEADVEFDVYTIVLVIDIVSLVNLVMVVGIGITVTILALGGAMIVDDNVVSDLIYAVDGLSRAVSASIISVAIVLVKLAAAVLQRKLRAAPASGKYV